MEFTLKEWALMYFKNRDIMLQKIDKIDEKDESIIISNNDGSMNHVEVKEFVDDLEIVVNTFKDKSGTLVMFNNKDNLDFVIDNWQKLIELKELTLIFVNPESLQEKKWIINPYVHDKVTEPKSLRAGLIALFTTVDPVLKK